MVSWQSSTYLGWFAKTCCNIVESYPEDLKSFFVDEFVQFAGIVVADNDKTITHMNELLKRDVERNAVYFARVANTLRIDLTNCEN